jgi:transcriptional regulator with XRE-family HTH domain
VASTARRRQLGTWLRKLRTDAGYTPTDAATVLDCSEAKIRHLEAGRSGAKKVELKRLLEFYGASDDVRAQLEETRKDGAKRGWWASYRLPSWFAPYVGFETDATEVRNFELDLIPGLLQIEQYAREVHRVGRNSMDTEAIDKSVAVRLERQRRLRTEPLLELRTVIAEEALRRTVGGSEVMKDQVEHLVEMAQLPNVIVQILPFSAGAQPSPHGPFVVLSFEDPEDEDIGFTDTPLGGHVIDEPPDVTALRHLFDELRSVALPAPDSGALLRSIATEYDG